MGFVDWARALFNKNTRTLSLDECHYILVAEVAYKTLAIETCISLIGNALALCEIQTFQKGKKYRGNNYYLLNVEPNVNQNATEFFSDLVRKYFYDEEALIIMQDDQLYIADEFEIVEFAMKPNIYKDVEIGGLKLNKVFTESEVIHIRLKNRKVKRLIDNLYESHGKLLASSMDYYRRKNNKRLLIKGDFLRAQTDAMQEKIDEMFEGQLRNWFDPDKGGVAFQLQDGYEIDDVSDSKSGAQGLSDSRDISSLVNDIFNYTAMAFLVPPSLLKGDLADVEKQTDNFITFAVKPFAELLADETNRKMYTKKDYLERTYLKVDTSKIKLVDITKLATALDKIFAIGGYTVNDVLEVLGGEPSDEKHADDRFVTKNYQRLSEASKGGDIE